MKPDQSAMEAVDPIPLHVAVLGFPFGSHAGPLLSLILKISASSPNVTFSFFSTARSIASVFACAKEEEIRNIKPYSVFDGLPEGFVPSGHPLEPVYQFLKATPDNYRRAMEEAVAEIGKRISCIVSDGFYWFSADMAKELQAKWVAVWAAGPNSLLSHVYTDLLRQKLGCNTNAREEQSLSFIPGFSTVKVADLQEGVVDGDLDEPIAVLTHKMGQTLHQATAVAINSFDAAVPVILNELKSKFQLLLTIGPFPLTTPQPNIPNEHGCLEFLETQKMESVAYISFGSVITPPPHEITALAEALEDSDVPFIWSFRGDPQNQLPKGFLERTKTKGKVIPWAPQFEILKHRAVGVFLSHCGWNSILESIVGGVPLICRPFFGDQRLNTRMLEAEWGVGVRVQNGVLSKDATVKVLEETLLGEKGKVMRLKIKEVRDSAMKAVDEASGSSTQNLKTLIEIVTT